MGKPETVFEHRERDKETGRTGESCAARITHILSARSRFIDLKCLTAAPTKHLRSTATISLSGITELHT